MKSHKSIHRRTKKNSLARTRKTKHSNAKHSNAKHSNSKRIYKKSHRGGSPTYEGVLITYPFVNKFIQAHEAFIASYYNVLAFLDVLSKTLLQNNYTDHCFTDFNKKLVELAKQYNLMIITIDSYSYEKNRMDRSALDYFIENSINTILTQLYEILNNILRSKLINPLEEDEFINLYNNAYFKAQQTAIKNPNGTVSYSEIAKAFLILYNKPTQIIYNTIINTKK